MVESQVILPGVGVSCHPIFERVVVWQIYRAPAAGDLPSVGSKTKGLYWCLIFHLVVLLYLADCVGIMVGFTLVMARQKVCACLGIK